MQLISTFRPPKHARTAAELPNRRNCLHYFQDPRPPKLAGKGVDVAYNSLSSPQVLYRKTNGDTVLHMSVRRRDLDLAKLFIEHGAEVDAQNVRPLTGLVPLVLADSARV